MIIILKELGIGIGLAIVIVGCILGGVYFCIKVNNSKFDDPQYQLITVDHCQYIKDIRRSSVPLVHSGNCTNHNKL